jgi:hypothetical protein
MIIVYRIRIKLLFRIRIGNTYPDAMNSAKIRTNYLQFTLMLIPNFTSTYNVWYGIFFNVTKKITLKKVIR